MSLRSGFGKESSGSNSYASRQSMAKQSVYRLNSASERSMPCKVRLPKALRAWRRQFVVAS